MSQSGIEPTFDAALLLAAWVVGVYALYVQSLVVRRVRAHEQDGRIGWLVGGALCVGTAIWSESLLGLLAWQLPIELGYVRAIVAAAWLPAVMISACAVWMQSQVALKLWVRALGGGLVSAGVGLLTCIHVSAMVLQPQLDWDPRYLAAAAVVLLLSSAIGSVLMRRVLQGPLRHLRAAGAAALVGSCFRAGQTLIVLALVVPSAVICFSADQLSPASLTALLTGPVLVLLALVHVGTIMDDRAKRQQAFLKQSLRDAKAALQELAHQDSASGLINRLGFEKALREALTADNAPVPALCVMRLNLDGFKAHIDTFGPDQGDAIVRYLADRLQGVLRQGDLLARADTDEFLLLCHGLGDAHQVTQLARRLRDAVQTPFLLHEQDIALSCSIGLACFPNSSNADQLLNHSRDAMLTARAAGGGVYCFYEPGMDRVGADQIEMQRDLRHAIERHELALHFQPKLQARDHRVAGVEALLRWQHPVRGAVSPVQFIPVAERFGLIGELGLWVLDEACRHIRQWLDAGIQMPVAINLSAHQLRQPDLEWRVREALKRHNIPAHMLIMEITESTAMDDIKASLRVFDMLDAIGVHLSIDDFGTGYSSLSYLRRLPARQLKIDRSFVNDLATSSDAQAIVEAVVRLAHALGLKVVAEGVETQDQALILTRLQCDELQGFLFARPMSERDLLAWLVQHSAAATDVGEACAAEVQDEGRCSRSVQDPAVSP